MKGFLDSLNGLELLFACCAVFGTVLFLLRTILMFLGHMGGSDTDVHGGAEGADGGDTGADGAVHDSDLSFKTLSLQGITVFFMMFGITGWMVMRMGSFHPIIPIGISLLTGGLMIEVMKKLFQWAGHLQSSGTLNLENAVGLEGTVYLTIRPGKAGKVQLTVQGRLAVLDAVTEQQEELKTGQTVRVAGISAGRLVVEKR
jgi:membrane protein implicated in regulation of membrane protease activity